MSKDYSELKKEHVPLTVTSDTTISTLSKECVYLEDYVWLEQRYNLLLDYVKEKSVIENKVIKDYNVKYIRGIGNKELRLYYCEKNKLKYYNPVGTLKIEGMHTVEVLANKSTSGRFSTSLKGALALLKKYNEGRLFCNLRVGDYLYVLNTVRLEVRKMKISAIFFRENERRIVFDDGESFIHVKVSLVPDFFNRVEVMLTKEYNDEFTKKESLGDLLKTEYNTFKISVEDPMNLKELDDKDRINNIRNVFFFDAYLHNDIIYLQEDSGELYQGIGKTIVLKK